MFPLTWLVTRPSPPTSSPDGRRRADLDAAVRERRVVLSRNASTHARALFFRLAGPSENSCVANKLRPSRLSIVDGERARSSEASEPKQVSYFPMCQKLQRRTNKPGEPVEGRIFKFVAYDPPRPHCSAFQLLIHVDAYVIGAMIKEPSAGAKRNVLRKPIYAFTSRYTSRIGRNITV